MYEVGVKDSYLFLSRIERIKLFALVLWQLLSSFLDIAGVVLTGTIAALATSSSNVNFSFLNWIPLLKNETSHSSDQTLVVLSGVALILFLAKSFFSIYYSRKSFSLLAKIQSRLAGDVILGLFQEKYETIKTESSAQIAFIMNYGISAAITNCLSQSITLISEFVLVFLMLLTLGIINPVIALGALIYFATIAVILNNIISPKVRNLGKMRSTLAIENQTILYSVLSLFREIRVLGRQQVFEKNLKLRQSNIALQAGKNIWLQQLPKYIMELSLVFGLFILIFCARLYASPASFIQVVSIYLIASARLFPSLLRIQSSTLTLKSSSGDARMAIDFITKFRTKSNQVNNKFSTNSVDELEVTENTPSIKIVDMSFRYDGEERDLLRNVSMEIPFGAFTILMGQSGSGKSTLCDLILGLLEPSNGLIQIDGISPQEWVAMNPGLVSYMTQDTNILSGTILENICLGVDSSEIDSTRLNSVLIESQLESFVSRLPQGVHTKLAGNGQGLSGGQKQRIGIARALYSDPKILVLDESTNALDIETQRDFMRILRAISSHRTIIFIAHNMLTINDSDSIIFFEEGKIHGPMDFESMTQTVSTFNKMMGSQE